MDTGSPSDDLPILPLRNRAMRKGRVPLHRDRDGSAVDQFDEQFVSGDADLLCEGFPFS
jgi:hypothetical protein